MRPTTRFAVLAASAAIALATSACGSNDNSMQGSMSGTNGMATSTSSATATGESGDVAFAQMMIPHHEQAVEMADLALENDTASQDVKALAAQIKGAQDPEIQTMKGWLSQWGATESAGAMDHGSGGMMGDDDMSSLMGASGTEFDQMWLEMMIEHHEGAIEMAQDVLSTTANADVEKLATAVVAGQEKEIATMQGMLS